MSTDKGLCYLIDFEVDLDSLKLVKKKLKQIHTLCYKRMDIINFGQVQALEYIIQHIDEVFENCADPSKD